ncbi:MAG: acyl-CoA desaturase [Polyangiaceae bacterium]
MTSLGFNRALRSAVNQRLSELGESRAGGAGMLLKLGLLLVNFAFWYALTLRLGPAHFALACLSNLAQALALVTLMLAVMHDGSHSAFSEHASLNRLAKWLLVLAGGSAIGWHEEHVVRHHSNTNVPGLDSDLESGGLLRFHRAQPWRPFHRFQHLYAWALYAIVSFKWTWFEDFDDVLGNRYGYSLRKRLGHTLEVVVAKCCQVALFVVVPARCFGLGKALVLYFTHFVAVSLAMALTFVLAHLSGVQAMPRTRRDAPDDWAEFQLASSANFATHNRALTWLLGGLNYQIEHHLFPHLSHRHYPMVSEIVRRLAAERGLAYHEFPSMLAALRAHAAHLNALGAAEAHDSGLRSQPPSAADPA